MTIRRRGARELWPRIERSILRSPTWGYGLAVVVTLATVFLRHALDSVWGSTKPFMLFFPTVMVAGRLGGFGPGVLCTGLSSLAIDYFWIEPYGALHIPHSKNVAGFAVFIASGLLISALNESLHRSVRRADRLHDARETLLAVVAHDLRNPLNALSLNIGVLRRGARSGEASERALSALERAVVRMDRLIRDLVDANRLESGSVEILLRDEDVGPIAREAIDGMAPVAAANRIEVTSAIAADLPAVRCDRGRVLQVIGNLLSNAAKFTPEGGRVSLTVVRDGAFVRFEVADSGPGILAEDAPHVFDRYWKKSAGAGTGLGLYIVKGLVAAHGGRSWLENPPEGGARFVVTLPVAA